MRLDPVRLWGSARRIGRRVVLLCAAVLLTFSPALTPSLAQPAVVVPTTLTITKTSLENVDGNGCSLYEALQAVFTANTNQQATTYHECTANPGPTLITFGGAAAGGTLTFALPPNTLDLPMIRSDVTIMGPVTLSGGGPTSELHIFRIASGGTLTLITLTLQDAHTSGGGAAILDVNGGTINLVGVSLQNNFADNDGGAINTNGALNVLGSTFAGNKALTGEGGAIHVSGSGVSQVAASNFSGNAAANNGGAIFFTGQKAEVSDSIFSGNILTATGATQGGGAIFNDSDTLLTIVRSAFNGNLSPGGHGGALYNNINATSVISDSSFNGNLAGDPSNARLGGAIYNQENLTIARSAFIGNAAVRGDGGAIAVDKAGAASVTNSTFTANGAPLGSGGGLVITNTQAGGPASQATLRNVTFSANASLNDGGAIYKGTGHSASLANTIVDGIGLLVDNCNAALTSLGHNLDSADTCGFNQSGDLTNRDPLLDVPFFNGGPLASLLTQKLKPDSPAIDNGDATICGAAPVNNEDQRGTERPKDGDANGIAVCDIGAFESDTLAAGYGSTPVQPGPIPFGNATIGNLITTTFTLFETGNTTLVVGNPVLGGANPGDFAINTTFPISITDGGADKLVALGCTPAATGNRSATLTLNTNDPAHLSVSYDLTCSGSAAPTAGFASQPIAPGPIDFGEIFLGSEASDSISVQETGNLALTLSNPALGGVNPGDFAVLTSFPVNIADGSAPQPVSVKCAPTALGIRAATLTLNTNDPTKPTVSFNLACTGVPIPPPVLVPGQSVTDTAQTLLNGAYGVAVSPDGKHVYVTGYSDNGVTVFNRNAATGALTFVMSVSNVDLTGARLIAVSPDGQNVYVAGSLANSIVSFKRSTTSGIVTTQSAIHDGDSLGCLFPPCGSVDGLGGAYGVAVSPDGRYVYVTGSSDDGIAVFYRDETNGDLKTIQIIGPTLYPNFIQALTGTVSLDGAQGLAISPDGAHLYATGFFSDTLVAFSRSASNGRLTHVQTRTDGELIGFFAFLDGLDGAFQVAVSPDGAYVYAVGALDDAVAAFRRNAADGKLTYLGRYRDGFGGVVGLDGAAGVAVSPSGTHLYAASDNDKAVVVFNRNAGNGLLTFSQAITRTPFIGVGGQPPLDGARDVATSPGGQHVYVAAFVDDAVAVLSMANPVPALDSLSPASATAGGPAFKLTVNGDDFVDSSVVRWNGADRLTTFVNPNQLEADVSAADVAATGAASVAVFNPAPGGGISTNVLTFTITAPGQNPVPSIDTLVPQGAAAGGPAFTLDVVGANFLPTSQVQWNGVARSTTYVNSAHLQAQVSVADLAAPGPAGVRVVNPGPGGGASNVALFDIAAPGENPVPSITQIRPMSTLVRGAAGMALAVSITGLNFVEGAQAQWNGLSRPTTFVNSTELQAVVTAADLAIAGTAGVGVLNPGPGGGASNTVTFMLFGNGQFIPIAVK